MAANKYYVVWAGRKPGIYAHWQDAKRQVDGYPRAEYKGFPSKAEAEEAFGSPSPVKPKTSGTEAPQVSTASSADVAIYCDGACTGNPGPCGTGIAIYQTGALHQLWFGLYRPAGTNNIAEILGLHHAMVFAKSFVDAGQTVVICTDSQYAIDCVATWAFGWKAKGWTKKGGAIKNLELIQAAHALFLDFQGKIAIEHVRGHAGIEGNELADRMSVLAIEKKEAGLGEYRESQSIAEILALNRG